MDRTGLRRVASIAALAATFAFLLAAPASAQGWGRCHFSSQGEPTDPDAAFQVLDENDVDLDAYGLGATPPETESEALTWFEALVNLLRTLGLLPGEGSD
jgi:hypothetical protein